MSFWYHARIRLSTCVIQCYGHPSALHTFCVLIHDPLPNVPVLSARRQARTNNSIIRS